MVPRPKRITLQDIADACGVSRNTVSQALRDNPLFTQETRDRIKAKAKELGYVKDPQLTRIMTQLSERRKRKDYIREEIAYLECIKVKQKQTEGEGCTVSHQDFFDGAKDFLDEQGYRLTVFTYKPEQRRISQINRIFATRGIRGVIVSPLPRDTNSIDLDWENLAGVSLGRQLRNPLLNRVDNNYANHCRVCFNKLWDQGCRRIALIMNRIYDGILQNPIRSTYMGELSLKSAESSPLIFDTSERDFRDLSVEETTPWLQENKVDGIICLEGDAIIARQCIENLDTPCDLAVLRFYDGLPEQGIMPDAKAVGETAAQQLLADMTFGRYGTPKHSKLIQIAGKWMEREEMTELLAAKNKEVKTLPL